MIFRLTRVLCVLGVLVLLVSGCDEVVDCTDIPSFCDDGEFCNGAETCVAGVCVLGVLPCESSDHCNEDLDTCLECIENSDCDNDLFCDGFERCINNTCEVGVEPCTGTCDEASTSCSGSCSDDTPRSVCDDACDDGLFCNGTESFSFQECRNGNIPCPDQFCVENEQVCVDCVTDDHCPGDEVCDDGSCQAPDAPDPLSIFITLRNSSGGNIHILTAQESFGPENRLEPNATRTVTTGAVSVGELFTFRAGVNGVVSQTAQCTFQTPADPDAAQAEVVWNGTALSCTGDLN